MLEFKKPDAYKNINTSCFLIKKNTNKYSEYLPKFIVPQIIPNNLNLNQCLVS